MGPSYMISKTMKAFVINLKLFNAALAISGSIHETLKVKLYKELDLELLKSRRWFRRLCCFYKIKTFGLPFCLSILISSSFHSFNTRNSEDVVT